MNNSQLPHPSAFAIKPDEQLKNYINWLRDELRLQERNRLSSGFTSRDRVKVRLTVILSQLKRILEEARQTGVDPVVLAKTLQEVDELEKAIKEATIAITPAEEVESEDQNQTPFEPFIPSSSSESQPQHQQPDVRATLFPQTSSPRRSPLASRSSIESDISSLVSEMKEAAVRFRSTVQKDNSILSSTQSLQNENFGGLQKHQSAAEQLGKGKGQLGFFCLIAMVVASVAIVIALVPVMLVR